jgi:hypothetical protein
MHVMPTLPPEVVNMDFSAKIQAFSDDEAF